MLTEKNIRNIFVYALPKFIGYGLNLITLPILTRILAPEDFGVVVLASVFPSIAVSLCTFSVAGSAQRFYFEYKADEEKYNAFIFSLQLFLILSFFVSSAGVFFLKGYISRLIIGTEIYGMAVFVSFLAAFLGQIISFYLIIYQNMEKAVTNSFFTIIQAILTAGLSLLLVWYFKLSYMGLIYGVFISTLLTFLILIFYFNRRLKIALSIKIVIENIRYGLQIVPKSFTGFINRFFDKYMLNNMLSLSAVGVYNIGQSVGNTMFFLMNAVWSAFQPVCYKDVFDKGKDASSSAGRLFTIFAYIALVPVFLLVLFAKEVVYIIAPPSYYGAIDVIVIILGGIATQVFGIYISIQFAYTKKAYWIFPVVVLGTLANIAGNIILIPHLGIIGAAVSTVLMYLVINGTGVYIGQKLYKIEYEWKIIAPLFMIITGAILFNFYLKGSELTDLMIYLVKGLFLVFFLLVGIMGKLITRQSIEKVYNSLFKLPVNIKSQP